MPKKIEQQLEDHSERNAVICVAIFLASLWGTFYLSDVLTCHYGLIQSNFQTCSTTWAVLPLWITGILICLFSFIGVLIIAGLSD